MFKTFPAYAGSLHASVGVFYKLEKRSLEFYNVLQIRGGFLQISHFWFVFFRQ